MRSIRYGALAALVVGVAGLVTATSSAQAVTPVVVVAGDSISWGTNTVDPPGDSWPALLQTRLGATAFVRDASIPGGCTFRWDCIGQPVSYRVTGLLKQPNVSTVLVTAGGNDLRRGATLPAYQSAYRALDAKVKAAGATMWVATIPPWRPALTGYAKFEPERERVNAWLRSAYHGRVLDFDAALRSGAVMDVRWASNDGLHPNVSGQARIANFVPSRVVG